MSLFYFLALRVSVFGIRILMVRGQEFGVHALGFRVERVV